MVHDCLVKNCKTNDLKGTQREKQFVRFPNHEGVKQKWINLLKINPSDIDSASKVCTLHFFKHQLAKRFKDSNIITIPQKSLPISVEVLNTEAGPSVSGKGDGRTSATSVAPITTTNDVPENSTEEVPVVRRSTRKVKSTVFPDGEPSPKRSKPAAEKSTPAPKPITPAKKPVSPIKKTISPVKKLTTIKQEHVDDCPPDTSETDSCDSWLIPKAKPPNTILSVKKEPIDRDTVKTQPLVQPVVNQPMMKIIEPRSLAKVVPTALPVSSTPTAQPMMVINAPRTLSNESAKPTQSNAVHCPPTNITYSPIIPLPIATSSPIPINPQLNSQFVVSKLPSNHSAQMVKQFNAMISARRNSLSVAPNIAEKQKIVVTAKNIELIKKALSNKKLVAARPLSSTGPPMTGPPLKLVSPQTLLIQRPEHSPPVQTTQHVPYPPANLAPVQPMAPISLAGPQLPNATNVVPNIIGRIPATNPKIAICPNPLLQNRSSTGVEISFAKTTPNPNQIQNPSATPPIASCSKTNPTFVVPCGGKDSTNNKNPTSQIIFKPAKRVESDIDLNIDLKLTNAHDLHTAKMQLNIVSRVVIALRTQLTRQQEEQKMLREQNAMILAKNHELIKHINNRDPPKPKPNPTKPRSVPTAPPIKIYEPKQPVVKPPTISSAPFKTKTSITIPYTKPQTPTVIVPFQPKPKAIGDKVPSKFVSKPIGSTVKLHPKANPVSRQTSDPTIIIL